MLYRTNIGRPDKSAVVRLNKAAKTGWRLEQEEGDRVRCKEEISLVCLGKNRDKDWNVTGGNGSDCKEDSSSLILQTMIYKKKKSERNQDPNE